MSAFGAKQTWRFQTVMSAFDPKQTSATSYLGPLGQLLHTSFVRAQRQLCRDRNGGEVIKKPIAI
jgi:hypothetical protein